MGKMLKNINHLNNNPLSCAFNSMQNSVSNASSYIEVLRNSLLIKDDIINSLTEQIKNKDKALDEHRNLINELQFNLSFCYGILVNLKDARNKRDVEEILSTFNVSLSDGPSLQ